jgi:hypothetical protein
MVFGVRAPLWESVDLGVVLVYFLSCDVFVCVRITHCVRHPHEKDKIIIAILIKFSR